MFIRQDATKRKRKYGNPLTKVYEPAARWHCCADSMKILKYFIRREENFINEFRLNLIPARHYAFLNLKHKIERFVLICTLVRLFINAKTFKNHSATYFMKTVLMDKVYPKPL